MTAAANQELQQRHDRIERLEDILGEMKDLIDEAEGLVRGTSAQARAKGYWIAAIRCALDEEHSYLSRSMCTLADTIEELSEEDDLLAEQWSMTP